MINSEFCGALGLEVQKNTKNDVLYLENSGTTRKKPPQAVEVFASIIPIS